MSKLAAHFIKEKNKFINLDYGNYFRVTIRQARKTKGYSQRELAEQIGLDFTYLSKFVLFLLLITGIDIHP